MKEQSPIELREVPGQATYPSRRRAEFLCRCGREFIAMRHNINSGITKSCGCYREYQGGMSGTHRSWKSMHYRTSNPDCKDYSHYGGRGIKVCERWQTFANFYADMGDRPKDHTLDRVDNGGDYCPENCRWATATEQCRNRRNNILLTISGETRTLVEWCELSGINYNTAQWRYYRGWAPEQVIYGR